MVEWSKLKTYEDDQPHSFEELCYQIAKGLYGNEGKFTRVDDSGGGDGVEFYLTLPNGDEWGWQAKFYYQPTGRLSVSNRKNQIKISLKRSCEKHPNLKKWILCTPSNFTPGEQTWFDERLIQLVPEAEGIELEHWGKSDFNDWLSEPRFEGKRLFFFGELELTMDWFRTQYKKQNSIIENKFNPILHSETGIDRHIKSILGDEELIDEIKELIEAIKDDEFLDYLRHKESCFSIFRSHIGNSNISELYDCLDFLEESLHHAFFKSKDIYYYLYKKMFFEAREVFISLFWESLDPIFNKCSNLEDLIISEFSYETSIDDDEINKILGATRRLVELMLSIQQDIDSILEILHSFNQSELHIMGEPGIGKTHVSSNICYKNLESNLPAILVLGRHFNNGLIGNQLLNILDIPRTYSFTHFLKALETAAEAYNIKIPLIIDGLNESTHNGEFSNVWALGLTSLIQEIKEYKNLVLITTCRPTYIDDIWINGKPNNAQNLYGFGFNNIEDAINKYFDYYKIKADLNESSISQFEHPIYLKIFCETKNPERKEEKNIHMGDYTLFEIFEEYLSNINTVLCKRIGLHQSAAFLVPRLKKIAEYLWNEDKYALPLDEMVKLIDGQLLDELENWPISKSKYILDEGLLINRDRSRGNDIVYFTYDLLGGYLIAKYLIEQSEDIEEVMQSEKVTNLFSEDRALHPLYEDIRRCLAALIPVKTGKYLHQLLDNSIALNTSIEALFEIPNEYINEDAIRIIKELFENPQNCEALLKLADSVFEHANHHFNIIFWNELLEELSLADRDLSWTEYLRKNVNDLEKKLIYFEETCKNNEDFSNLMENRLYLLAINAMWFLTSTLKQFRDKATRALYWYGRRFPKKLFELMVISFEINDPYVSERMVAAAYGVCMALQYDFKDNTFSEEILPIYGRKLFDLMFNEKAPYSTTHILKRDYARQIIEISLIHHPAILTKKEIERIKPPYNDGGIRNWGESKDKDSEKYRNCNDPMEGIVHEDPVSLLGQGMDKYQKPPAYVKAKSNLWWRVYQLGYLFELFSKIDEEIELQNDIIRNSDEIEWAGTYGRKYVFIAVHELAGCRDDHALLKPDWEMDYRRTSLVNIDPSFPIDVNEFKLVDDDFLGKDDISIIEWILEDYAPNMNEYLIIDEIDGEKGPWVLLDGYIGQTDDESNRDIYIFPRGFFVQSKDENEVIKRLNDQDLFGRWLPEINEDHYVYAGEIPWCDTFPDNEFDELLFEIGKEKIDVPIKKKVIMCDGVQLSEQEEQAFWDSISDKVIVTPYENYFDVNKDIKFDIKIIEKELEQLNNIESEFDNSENLIINLGNISRIHDELEVITGFTDDNPKEILKLELEKQGLERKIIEVKIKKERQKYEKFKVLSPVRENHWEMSNFPVIPDRNVTIPIRQITESLQLCSQPQTFDLYDNNGNKASKYVHYGERYRNNQHFMYLRKDLFDLFLSKNNYKFIWAIWGGKEFSSEEEDEIFEFRREHEDQKSFKEIIAYDSIKN